MTSYLNLKKNNFRFGYSNKLNKEDESDSSGDSNLVPAELGLDDDELKANGVEGAKVVFPMTISNERQLFQLSRKLTKSRRHKSTSGAPLSVRSKFNAFGQSVNMPGLTSRPVVTIAEEEWDEDGLEEEANDQPVNEDLKLNPRRPMAKGRRRKRVKRCLSAPNLSKKMSF